MSANVQVTFEPELLARVRDHARQANQTVSAWLHELAARQVGDRPPQRFESIEERRKFLAAWDARQGPGREPDWEEHRRHLDDAILSGIPTDV